MDNLKGKRLLLLGGDFWTEELAQYAKTTGVKLIATAKKAPSKLFEIAEESYTVDPTDAEGMKKLIRDAKIDAVHPGSSEPVIGAASAYLRELGLPCYATPE